MPKVNDGADLRDPMTLARIADEIGIRLEIMGGRHTWEAFPSYRHQIEIDRIRASLPAPGGARVHGRCGCIHVADAYFLFPDGSLKRPDVAVLCDEPPADQQRLAIRVIPEAVIEVISPGYEDKDLDLSPRFYLSQGVKDVVVVDSDARSVIHFRRDATRRLQSPAKIMLECGCPIEA